MRLTHAVVTVYFEDGASRYEAKGTALNGVDGRLDDAEAQLVARASRYVSRLIETYRLNAHMGPAIEIEGLAERLDEHDPLAVMVRT